MLEKIDNNLHIVRYLLKKQYNINYYRIKLMEI